MPLFKTRQNAMQQAKQSAANNEFTRAARTLSTPPALALRAAAATSNHRRSQARDIRSCSRSETISRSEASHACSASHSTRNESRERIRPQFQADCARLEIVHSDSRSSGLAGDQLSRPAQSVPRPESLEPM
ncbi:unnamed protein product [Diplocarpon coronariae]|nr:hypothetical protein JHW43_002363 [Diplocarpon mali]